MQIQIHIIRLTCPIKKIRDAPVPRKKNPSFKNYTFKQNRWDPITFSGDHEYTNDAVVARWKEETGKWLAVRKIESI